jgi:hypothetical protein
VIRLSRDFDVTKIIRVIRMLGSLEILGYLLTPSLMRERVSE